MSIALDKLSLSRAFSFIKLMNKYLLVIDLGSAYKSISLISASCLLSKIGKSLYLNLILWSNLS